MLEKLSAAFDILNLSAVRFYSVKKPLRIKIDSHVQVSSGLYNTKITPTIRKCEKSDTKAWAQVIRWSMGSCGVG